MNIDFGQVVTAEEKQQAAQKAAYETATAARRAAYQAESDPLRLEIEYDSLIEGKEPDFGPWVAMVADIKARYPLPESPKG